MKTSDDQGRVLLARILVALASGAILALAFAPSDIGWLAPVGVAVLLSAVHGTHGRRAALLGALSGAVFFGGLLTWTVIFGAVAWIALVLSQAALFGMLGIGLARALQARSITWRVVAIAGVWVALELVRSRFPLGGFPWGLLGVSQHAFAPARATAAWTGTVGLSAIVAAMGALLWETGRRVRPRRREAIMPAVALAGLFALQAAATFTPRTQEGPPVRVAIVQGGVEPGTIPAERELSENEAAHARLTLEAARSDPDLIVWGEDVLDLAEDQSPDAIGRLSAQIDIPILAGYTREVPDGRFENVVGLFDGEARELERYVKQRPVPFGEYVPLRGVIGGYPPLRQVPRDMVRGGSPTVFRPPDGPTLGSLISFESVFSDLGGALVSRGASILVVNTNNASFRRSALARQHLAADQMRAAEQGRYLVRAAITGISAVIDPDGRVVSSLPLFRPAVLLGTVRPIARRTPFGIASEWPVAALAILGVLITLRTSPAWSDRAPNGSIHVADPSSPQGEQGGHVEQRLQT